MHEDNLLLLLTRRVETSDFRTPITLTIGGIVLQGDMVSLREFCEGVAETTTIGPPEEQEMYRRFFRDIPERFDKATTQFTDETKSQLAEVGLSDDYDPQAEQWYSRARYVHLKNTQVLVGQSDHATLNNTGFWRGKVSAVDGFWLGRTTEVP